MPTPIESYNSSVLYTADGLTSVFPFPFPYQNAADIFVSKNDVDQAGSFTITGGTNVSLTPMPAAGARIKIYRKTGHSARRVDFTDGATITEADLDKSAIQHFYMGQEGYDLAKSLVNTVGDVASAVQLCTDAKNSAYASQVAALDSRNTALAHAVAAGDAYSLAAGARNDAIAARDAALSYSNSASANAISAANDKNTASTAATTASAAATTATTKAGEASTSASFALSSKNDAAASATAAYNSKVAAEAALGALEAFVAPSEGTAGLVVGPGWADLSGGECFVYKQGKVVTLNLNLYVNNAGALTTTIATLPAGYRPRYGSVLAGAAVTSTSDSFGIAYTCYIDTAGIVYLYNPLNNPTTFPTFANGYRFRCNVSFLTP